MGFNGSISSSKGKGTIVGFTRSAQGQRVPLRIPNAYPVQGAPNDLLSVSSMVSQGYSFHFTPERSYVVTPAKEELDLVHKSGLYWLKWHRAINPAARHDISQGVRRVIGAQIGAQPKGSFRGDDSSTSELRDEALDEFSTIELTNNSNDNFSMVGKSPPVYLVKPCSRSECHFCNAATGAVKIPMSLMHRRCIHWNTAMLSKMSKNRAIDLVPKEVAETICVCEVCKAAKATRKAVSKTRESEPETTKPFSRVWTDVKGKVDADFWGNKYVITFTCEVTRWTCVYFCQKKSQAKDRLKEFIQWVKRMGHKVDRMQSDGGGEYTSNENAKVLSEFQVICLEHDIEQNFTAAHTPAQNGVAERVNRTLVEHARCLLINAGLSSNFWSLAVKHVAYCRNRLWHQKHQVSANVGQVLTNTYTAKLQSWAICVYLVRTLGNLSMSIAQVVSRARQTSRFLWACQQTAKVGAFSTRKLERLRLRITSHSTSLWIIENVRCVISICGQEKRDLELLLERSVLRFWSVHCMTHMLTSILTVRTAASRIIKDTQNKQQLKSSMLKVYSPRGQCLRERRRKRKEKRLMKIRSLMMIVL